MDNKILITRIKSNTSEAMYYKSEASTTMLDKPYLLSLASHQQSAEALNKDYIVEEGLPLNNNKLGDNVLYDLKMAELAKVQLLKMETNANHLQSQFQPIQHQNHDLKEYILAQNYYMEVVQQQRVKLAALIQPFGANGENRELVKKIGDFETLLQILQDDLSNKDYMITLQGKNIQSQLQEIQDLVRERESNYDKMKQIFKLKKQKYKDLMSSDAKALDEKNQEILSLKKNIEDENERILRTQMLFQQQFKKLGDKIEEQESIINESNKNYKELQKQSELQITMLRADFTQQQTMLQDQYEFSLGELRFAYELRMEKQLQECENKVREAVQEKERFSKELEQALKERKNEQRMRENAEVVAQTSQQQLLSVSNQFSNAKDQITLLQNNLTQTRQNRESLLRERDNALVQFEETEIENKRLKLEISQVIEVRVQRDNQLEGIMNEQVFFKDQMEQQKRNYESKIRTLQQMLSVLQSQKNVKLTSPLYNKIENNIKDIIKEDDEQFQIVKQRMVTKTEESREQEQLSEDDLIRMEKQNLKQDQEQFNAMMQQQRTESDNNNYQITDNSVEYNQEGTLEQQQLTNQQQQQLINQQQDIFQQSLTINQTNTLSKNQEIRNEKKQRKHQNKVLHLKNQVKKAKTILYEQKKRQNEALSQIQGEYRKLQEEKIRMVKEDYEKEIEKFKEQYQQELHKYEEEHEVIEQEIEQNERLITELQYQKSEVELQLVSEKQVSEYLTEQCANEVERIINETNKRIQEGNLIKQLYERQFVEYEEQFCNLQRICEKLIQQSQEGENENKRLNLELNELNRVQQEREMKSRVEQSKTQKYLRDLKGDYDTTVRQMKLQIQRADESLRLQEQQQRLNIDKLQKIIEQCALENKMLQEMVIKNEEKAKKYNELRQDYFYQSYILITIIIIFQSRDKNKKVEEQLNKASEIIRYFNIELENYKKVYNIFNPPPQEYSQLQQSPDIPKIVIENRMLHSKIHRIKEKHHQQIFISQQHSYSNQFYLQTQSHRNSQQQSIQDISLDSHRQSDMYFPQLDPKYNQNSQRRRQFTVQKLEQQKQQHINNQSNTTRLMQESSILMDNLYEPTKRPNQLRGGVASIDKILK